jgi:hypothetical protein
MGRGPRGGTVEGLPRLPSWAASHGERMIFLRADDGARTHDPQLGKLMLYQLSYVRAALILAPVR